MAAKPNFPDRMAAFVSGADNFTATIRKDLFPYFTQNQKVAIAGLDLYG
jgi:hypothetical protein